MDCTPLPRTKDIWKWLCTNEHSITFEDFTIKANLCKIPDEKHFTLYDDISKDCIRTFIDGEVNADDKREHLSIILKVYGRSHPDIGYVQGMISQ